MNPSDLVLPSYDLSPVTYAALLVMHGQYALEDIYISYPERSQREAARQILAVEKREDGGCQILINPPPLLTECLRAATGTTPLPEQAIQAIYGATFQVRVALEVEIVKRSMTFSPEGMQVIPIPEGLEEREAHLLATYYPYRKQIQRDLALAASCFSFVLDCPVRVEVEEAVRHSSGAKLGKGILEVSRLGGAAPTDGIYVVLGPIPADRVGLFVPGSYKHRVFLHGLCDLLFPGYVVRIEIAVEKGEDIPWTMEDKHRSRRLGYGTILRT